MNHREATTTLTFIEGGVFKTTNGGGRWTKQLVPASVQGKSFFDVEVWAGGSQAVIVGEDGVVLMTDGLGNLNIENLGTLSLTDITLRDVDVLFAGAQIQACGDNGTFFMRDSAGTWTQERTFTNNPLHKVAFQGTSNGLAIGRPVTLFPPINPEEQRS